MVHRAATVFHQLLTMRKIFFLSRGSLSDKTQCVGTVGPSKIEIHDARTSNILWLRLHFKPVDFPVISVKSVIFKIAKKLLASFVLHLPKYLS